jgi:hypothetical protein
MSVARNHTRSLKLSEAAKAARTSRGNFFRQFQKRLVPPPTHWVPHRRWFEEHIEKWRRGEVVPHPETGIWCEWVPELENWRRLPNQYPDALPPRSS